MGEPLELNYQVRAAEPADADQLVALWNADQPGHPTGEFEQALRAVLRSETHVVFVMEAGGVAGCIHGAILPMLGEVRTLHIFSLIVATPHRRRGIARRLLAVAEAWARAQGCETCTTADASKLVGAGDFWRAVGYEHAATAEEYRKRLQAL